MSTPVIETVDLVEPWVYGRLTGDTELAGMVGDRIHNAMALGKQTGVYVIFSLEDSRDVTNHVGEVIDTIAIYLIKAVAATASFDTVVPAARRIEALFHRPRETFTLDGGSLTSLHETRVQYPEFTDGVSYRHLGARYRIRAAAH